jgi:hypothetical protein
MTGARSDDAGNGGASIGTPRSFVNRVEKTTSHVFRGTGGSVGSIGSPSENTVELHAVATIAAASAGIHAAETRVLNRTRSHGPPVIGKQSHRSLLAAHGDFEQSHAGRANAIRKYREIIQVPGRAALGGHPLSRAVDR